jgi:hypothetical protein|tara:strand:- start:1043 stop:1294 length:252 start_codon:yes stop_codon:yes gene_type:complete
MEIMEHYDVAYTNNEERVLALESLNDYLIRETLENDMMIPCDACNMTALCESSGKECSAFRNWASTGDYEAETLQKHLRLPRS